MQEILTLREVQLFIACVAIAFFIAWLHSSRQATDSPVWPVRLYLFIIDMARIPGIGEYSRSRKSFSRREQFLGVFFAWFFILFVVAVAVLGCGRKGC